MANAHDLLMAQRAAMMGGLPYDRVVTAINSLNFSKNRLAYVNTGIFVDPTMKWECKYALKSIGNYNNATNCGNSGVRFTFGKGSQSWNDFYIGIGDTNFRTGIPIDKNIHIYKIDATTNRLEFDNDIFTTSATVGTATGFGLTLFARFSNSTGVYADTIYHDGELHYSKIWKGGDLVQSLIPVVKDNLGYLYDEVTGAMFGNDGNGGAGFEPECIVETA